MDKFVVGQLVRIKTNQEHLRDKVWVVRRVLEHDILDLHLKDDPVVGMLWDMVDTIPILYPAQDHPCIRKMERGARWDQVIGPAYVQFCQADGGRRGEDPAAEPLPWFQPGILKATRVTYDVDGAMIRYGNGRSRYADRFDGVLHIEDDPEFINQLLGEDMARKHTPMVNDIVVLINNNAGRWGDKVPAYFKVGFPYVVGNIHKNGVELKSRDGRHAWWVGLDSVTRLARIGADGDWYTADGKVLMDKHGLHRLTEKDPLKAAGILKAFIFEDDVLMHEHLWWAPKMRAYAAGVVEPAPVQKPVEPPFDAEKALEEGRLAFMKKVKEEMGTPLCSFARIGQERGRGNDFKEHQPCHATFKYANGSVWVDQIYTYFTKDRRYCGHTTKEFDPKLGPAFFEWVVNDTIFADGFVTKDFDEAMEKGVVMNNEASYLETFGGAVFMRQVNEYGGIHANLIKLLALGLFEGDNRAAAYVVADMVTIQKDKVFLNGSTYNGHRCWGSATSSIAQIMAALKPTKKVRERLPAFARFKAGWDGIEVSLKRLADNPEKAHPYLDKYPAWVASKQGWNDVKVISFKDEAELKKVLQDLITYINKGA